MIEQNVSIDPRLSSVDSNNQFIVNIKTAVVTALRNTLDDKDYPDQKIQGIKVSMEYPVQPVEYPCVWVNFRLTKLQAYSVGGQYDIIDGKLVQSWAFEGVVNLTVLALSSFERDVYSSQLLQLFAFGPMNPMAAQFEEIMHESDVPMQINRDTLSIGGSSENVGVPWDENIIAYSDSYGFQIIGDMKSSWNVTPAFLRKISITGEMEGDPSGEHDFEYENSWQ